MAATTTNRELWRDAIQRTLAHRAGDVPDASAVSEATASAWRQVDALLTPLIGANGVDVIFRRALSLTSKVFPWLAIGEEHGDSSALLVSLKVQLAGRDTATVTEVACTLMVTFIELLSTLIGESLTERIVSSIWASPLPPSEQETES